MLGFVNNSKDGTNKIFNVEEFDINRHIKLLQYSGFNKSDKVKNIYDLEGNVQEWVAEQYRNNLTNARAPVVRRRNTES